VAVTVSSAQPWAIVATYSGTLARGDDVQHESRTADGEALMLVIEEDYGTLGLCSRRTSSSSGAPGMIVGEAVLLTGGRLVV